MCPSNDELLAYFERRLAPAGSEEIASHIDRCEACLRVIVIVVRAYRDAGNSCDKLTSS